FPLDIAQMGPGAAPGLQSHQPGLDNDTPISRTKTMPGAAITAKIVAAAQTVAGEATAGRGRLDKRHLLQHAMQKQPRPRLAEAADAAGFWSEVIVPCCHASSNWNDDAGRKGQVQQAPNSA